MTREEAERIHLERIEAAAEEASKLSDDLRAAVASSLRRYYDQYNERKSANRVVLDDEELAADVQRVLEFYVQDKDKNIVETVQLVALQRLQLQWVQKWSPAVVRKALGVELSPAGKAVESKYAVGELNLREAWAALSEDDRAVLRGRCPRRDEESVVRSWHTVLQASKFQYQEALGLVQAWRAAGGRAQP